MVLFFRFEAVFMPETASEKEQLWQLGEARVFDQMTSDQASGGLKHEYYHHFHSEKNRFQMTPPKVHILHSYFIANLKFGNFWTGPEHCIADFNTLISLLKYIAKRLDELYYL